MGQASAEVSFDTFAGKPPENYEKYFVPAIGKPFATQLVEAAALRPGERVLDVACGTGIVARLAAEAVGPTGTAAGLDSNPGMLAVARGVSEERIVWHEAPADRIPLEDGSVDVVLCSLGVKFFQDRVAGLTEMHRILEDGGRVAFNAVGPTPPLFEILDQALARHVSPEAAAFMRVVFSLHDEDEIRDLLLTAGFDDVSTNVTAVDLELPAPRDFLWRYIHSTPVAAAVSQVDDEHRSSLEHDVLAGWDRYTRDGTLHAQPRVVVATGRKGG